MQFSFLLRGQKRCFDRSGQCFHFIINNARCLTVSDKGVDENERLMFSNSFGLKRVFEKLRFLDGLVWTVVLTGEMKLPF